MFLEDLQKDIDRAAAEGVNRTTDILLDDIRINAPRRTGKLSASYQQVEIATPDNLTARIESNVSYGAKFYPVNPLNFGRRGEPARKPALFLGSNPEQVQQEILARETEAALLRGLGN